MSVRVRIAPSPTGNLHIGTTRTALFNYLFARRHGGSFILRVEDTDKQRSKAEYTQNILSGLQGLGLNWDEGPNLEGEEKGDYGPYAQSQRGASYSKYLQLLLQEEKIYPCFCSSEELQVERQAAESVSKTYVYSQRCRALDPVEAQKRIDAGEKAVYRLKVPEKKVTFTDLVRGEVSFDTRTLGDFIIARKGLDPLYNFAVVIDDYEMKITHVLRGEDHISNTPKQILIYEAIGATVPQFGHTAMMLAPDRSKLSKRHGATSVGDYLDQGYLPEALVNYLALLGWSPPDDQEIFTLSELEAAFDLSTVSKSGAVFDVEKLKWTNSQWIKRLSEKELWLRLEPILKAKGYSLESHDEAWWLSSVVLVQEKLTLLGDYLEQVDFLLADELEYEVDKVQKSFIMPSFEPVLEALKKALETMDWNAEALHQIFEQLKSDQPFKMKEIMWPIRTALTGRTFGADLQQSILLLGQANCLKRIDKALNEAKSLERAHA